MTQTSSDISPSSGVAGPKGPIALIVINHNEGERLRKAFDLLPGTSEPLIDC
jgi:hypothetical protein